MNTLDRYFRGSVRRFVAGLALAAMISGAAHAMTAEEARDTLDESQRLAGERDHAGALAAFTAVKEANPDAIEAIDALKIAVVLAVEGDEDAILSHAQWLADRYADSPVATDAERSVKGYLVYPGASDPDLLAHALERTRHAVEQAAAHDEDELLPWFHTSYGLAYYRNGDYDAAAAWLGKSVDADILYIRSLAQPFAAAAELARGNAAAAEAKLAKARKTAAELPQPGTGEYAIEWTDTLAAGLALAEVEAKFKNPPENSTTTE